MVQVNQYRQRGSDTRYRTLRDVLGKIGARPAFRLLVFGFGATAWFGLIVLWLWGYQVQQADYFVEQAKKQQEGTIQIKAARGIIYDRFGEKLAFSVPVDSIGVFPQRVPNPELTAGLLAEVLKIDQKHLYKKLTRNRFQWIRRLAEPGKAERVRNLNPAGIHFEKESKRYYPHGSLAAHLLGAVGVDHTGQAGLEQKFEKLLRGKQGVRLVQYDARRSYYAGKIVKQPIPGASLVLTIDHRIQIMAERELARAIGETQAVAGTIVIIDPHNGELLAVANWPTFNPNKRVQDEKELALRQNFALSRLFEPGSTFKIIPIAGVLEEKLARPGEILDCQMGAIYIGSRRVRDHKPYGLLTVGEILAKSSNVGAIKLAMRLEPDRLYQYARKFGFGQKTGLPLPGEIAGLLRPVEKWQRGSIGSVPIGQEVGVTAIQIARAVSVIANGGLLIQPTLVQSIRHPDGKVEERHREPARRILSAETAAIMRALMEGVVKGGTGRLAATPGYRVGGKTGTAQKIDPETHTYSRTQYVPSFVGFAPVNNPSIAVVIVLDSPVGEYYGGSVAAPVFPRVATQALRFRNVPPELPVPSEPEDELPPADELLADFIEIPEEERDAPAEAVDVRGPILVAAAPSRRNSALAPHRRPAQKTQADQGLAEVESENPPEPVSLRIAARVVPDFAGKTVQQVVAQTVALGFQVDLRGSGFAYRQRPPAGTPVHPGQKIAVEFMPSLAGLEEGR